jgi:hypothetical protein
MGLHIVLSLQTKRLEEEFEKSLVFMPEITSALFYQYNVQHEFISNRRLGSGYKILSFPCRTRHILRLGTGLRYSSVASLIPADFRDPSVEIYLLLNDKIRTYSFLDLNPGSLIIVPFMLRSIVVHILVRQHLP